MDKAGGLIAGATLNRDVSLGWGDSQGVTLGSLDETRWYHWPARPPAADAALAEKQSFEWRRYWWINHTTTMPTRMINYYLEPVCVRLQALPRAPGDTPPSQPFLPVARGDTRCPPGWRPLSFAATYNTDLTLPERGGPRYRLEWVLMKQPDQPLGAIEIDDVRELPAMPGRESRKHQPSQ